LAEEVKNVIRILLVDDQPTVRQGWRMGLALEADMAVIGEAGDGQEAVEMALALRPDVVLMDIEMPAMDGMAAAAALHLALTECATILISIHDNATTRARVQAAGAAGFVGKHEPFDALLATIRRACLPK
jgi:two-component system response regulator DesR